MKIVHINWSDTEGGAAIAASRHCEAMKLVGIDAKLLTIVKGGRKPYVKKIHLGIRIIHAQLFSLLYEKAIKRLHAIGTFSIMKYGHPFHKDIEIQTADVIIIHWVNHCCMSLKNIENILKLGKPTFWYMHDMFPITGGCHHSLSCEAYKFECKDCPLIRNKKQKSVAAKQLKHKIMHWGKYGNLNFITPSRWLGECVKNSTLSKGHNVFVIPNVINTDVFHPEKSELKTLLGLNPSKKTVIFSAATYANVYKGAKYMHDFLEKLDPQKYEALAIGLTNDEFIKDLNVKIVSTGYLNDDLSMVVAYNCSDVLVISSVAENYPNVVLEAMACGVPCVGFPVGGIKDLIVHKETGYVTKNLCIEELIEGVKYVIADEDRYKLLSMKSRDLVVRYNSFKNVKEIYREVPFLFNE